MCFVNLNRVQPDMSAAPAAFSIRHTVLDLALSLIRPRKKGMRLDVRMKRLAAPYPRNIHRKKDYPSDSGVLRGLFGDK